MVPKVSAIKLMKEGWLIANQVKRVQRGHGEAAGMGVRGKGEWGERKAIRENKPPKGRETSDWHRKMKRCLRVS